MDALELIIFSPDNPPEGIVMSPVTSLPNLYVIRDNRSKGYICPEDLPGIFPDTKVVFGDNSPTKGNGKNELVKASPQSYRITKGAQHVYWFRINWPEDNPDNANPGFVHLKKCITKYNSVNPVKPKVVELIKPVEKASRWSKIEI